MCSSDLIPYDQALTQALGLAELSLQVYLWDADKQKWTWLSSAVDPSKRVVTATTSVLSLMKVVGKKNGN